MLIRNHYFGLVCSVVISCTVTVRILNLPSFRDSKLGMLEMKLQLIEVDSAGSPGCARCDSVAVPSL
ncbi:uncharacterized protein HKW66_Vig0054150 [Vigna angularis]|uniref:Uncharacterized protein n=1 Tax=Phaseolus angularis TaxID=3914 RepID=A0A8T0L1X1_PHAAN|nr:uncharacterized protein HKW66_Vig0054130 [Vigna angularis]KAG2406159.1 uncharacterized protein HKW66_Vig0054150 [Vigna angularis]